MEKIYRGRAWVFGDNVDTGSIVSGKNFAGNDNSRLGEICLLDVRPDFAKEARPGDIVVAGKNFGCGSSREHAAIALQQRVSCVLADSFARIFYRNSVNRGLYLGELRRAADFIADGDMIEVDFGQGIVYDRTKGERHKILPLPEFMRRMYESGGLYGYIERRLFERGVGKIL